MFYNDYSAKENTEAILAALATSSNPDEINNAAVVCRNYSKGCIGKGQWDLPSGGYCKLINDNGRIIHSLNTILREILKFGIISSSIWSSTPYSSTSIRCYNPSSGKLYLTYRDQYARVVPIYLLN